MLNWYFVTKAQYDAATTKSADSLYFLSDTKQIFRGTEPFTDGVSLFTTTKPTTPAVGRLYIESATLEGFVYTGSEWKTVIKPVDATVNADSENPVSGKAVAAYVTAAIADAAAEAKASYKDVSYSATTNKLTFTTNDGQTKDVEISNLPVDLMWTEGDGTGLLQLKDKSGAAIGTGINLDLERFVKSGEYDADTKKITLYFDDAKTEKVEIDASALVDIYTGEASTSATVTVSADNKIKAEVKLAEAADNTLKVHADGGLYVAPTNLDAYATTDAVTSAVAAEKTRAEGVEGTLNTAVEAAQSSVNTLSDKVGTVPTGKTVVQMISDAQTAATYDDSALTARVKANEDALSVVQGTGTGSISKALSDAKEYADGLNTTMDGRVTTLEGASHTHANKAELDKIATGDKAKWDQAVADLATESATARAAEQANASDIDALEAALTWKTSI